MINVRITDSDKGKIEEIKKQTGLNTSEVIRNLLNDKK